MTNIRTISTCMNCGFASTDFNLVKNHSCDVQEHGGSCEDYPACGHEWGDCNGLKYGSDESIKEWAQKHVFCEHEHGFCNLDEEDETDEGDED